VVRNLHTQDDTDSPFWEDYTSEKEFLTTLFHGDPDKQYRRGRAILVWPQTVLSWRSAKWPDHFFRSRLPVAERTLGHIDAPVCPGMVIPVPF
jgi:hypothetical protein